MPTATTDPAPTEQRPAETTTERAAQETTTASPVEGPTEGLRLWLDATRGVETADGAVRTWRDQSGNGYHLTQSDSERRPTFQTETVRGIPGVRFDGSDDRFLLENTLGIPDDSARTFVVVSRLADPAARSPFLIQGAFDSTGADASHYGLDANTANATGERWGFVLNGVAFETFQTTNDHYNVHLLQTGTFPDFSAMEQSTKYYVFTHEASYRQTPGDGENHAFEGDATAIGSYPVSDPSSVVDGDIAEIRVYDRLLDDDERDSLTERLRSRYS